MAISAVCTLQCAQLHSADSQFHRCRCTAAADIELLCAAGTREPGGGGGGQWGQLAPRTLKLWGRLPLNFALWKPFIFIFVSFYTWTWVSTKKQLAKSGEFLVLGRDYLGPWETFALPPPPPPTLQCSSRAPDVRDSVQYGRDDQQLFHTQLVSLSTSWRSS